MSCQVTRTDLGEHPQQQIPQLMRDLGVLREPEGLVLHHLEEIETRGDQKEQGSASKKEAGLTLVSIRNNRSRSS